MTSDYLLEEILQIIDPQRQSDVMEMTRPAALHVAHHLGIDQRAKEFASSSITGHDALHLAAAEAAGADYFVTTDQRLLRRAARAATLLRVKTINPANWPPTES